MRIAALPDASTIAYRHDNAHRLAGIADSPGNPIDYTPDKMSNSVQDGIIDALGTIVKTQSRTYDALNRLTGIDYPGTDADVVNAYDGNPNQKGRLISA